MSLAVTEGKVNNTFSCETERLLDIICTVFA